MSRRHFSSQSLFDQKQNLRIHGAAIQCCARLDRSALSFILEADDELVFFISLLARYFEEAIEHIKRSTKPTKSELKAWQDELSNYQNHSIDELEDKLKESADRLADAREKLGMQPHRHKFGIYNK